MKKKRIAILGSTGSIGCNTLKVIGHLSDRFEVVALAAKGNNIELLERQAKEFAPKLIAVYDGDKAQELKKRLPSIAVLSGLSGLEEVASHHRADLVVSAMTGTIGIIPTIAAIQAGKDVALANKEVLVSAGQFVMELAFAKGVSILPIDSEHSALFQCLKNEPKGSIRRLILTASGGPFLHFSNQALKEVTLEKALSHPTWVMGPKVTIDSSTLMNKGLEVIEARWLFDCDQIEVVVHPQSVIHSMVEFVDGSMLAQMSHPNMITPIQYALTYPERLPSLLQPYDFTKYPRLDFSPPDHERFPCLNLAFQALKIGGTASCFLNAANEVLVDRFLKKEISWLEISSKLNELMAGWQAIKESETASITLEKILETDTLARELAINR